MITRNKKYVPLFVHAMFTAFLGLASVASAVVAVVLPKGPPEALAGLLALFSGLGAAASLFCLCEVIWKRICEWAEEKEA